MTTQSEDEINNDISEAEQLVSKHFRGYSIDDKHLKNLILKLDNHNRRLNKLIAEGWLQTGPLTFSRTLQRIHNAISDLKRVINHV